MQAGLELEIFTHQLLNPKTTGVPHHTPQEFTLFGEEQHTVSVKRATDGQGYMKTRVHRLIEVPCTDTKAQEELEPLSGQGVWSHWSSPNCRFHQEPDADPRTHLLQTHPKPTKGPATFVGAR